MTKKNKRNMIINVFKGMMTTTIIIISFLFCGYIQSHYSIAGYVDKIKNNIITVIDTTGNIWDYEPETEEEKSLKEHDKVTIHFFNEGTETERIDDSIVNIEKE